VLVGLQNLWHEKLNIQAPDDTMESFTTKMMKVTDNITVAEFEEKNNSVVRIVYNEKKDNMMFPSNDLKLNGKYVLFDK